MDSFRTKRLMWRMPQASDLDEIHGLVSDFDVVKSTATWPYPADKEFNAKKIAAMNSETGMGGAIYLDGELIGLMGVQNTDLGYMFARKHWGQGYATEMASAIIGHAFARFDWDEIGAGHWQDNPASGHVLAKLGFVPEGPATMFCKAQNCDVRSSESVLTRADWLAANPLVIETERLVIRSYGSSDTAVFHSIAGQNEVAQMMQSVPHPFSLAQAQEWIDKRRFQGRLGFCAGVYLRDGTLIGNVGIGGDPVSTMYFIDTKHWGKGYASEAMEAFVSTMFARFDLAALIAGTMHDNPASGRVLQKLGFVQTGQKLHQPSLRDAPETLHMYALSRHDLAARSGPVIKTDRLQLDPLREADWRELQRLGSDLDVSRMLLSIKQPWSEADVKNWISSFPWTGAPNYRLGIRLKDGGLIGACGYFGAVNSGGIAYFLGREFWGNGYAFEAAEALILDAFARFGAASLTCGVFQDNAASIRILERLGFARVGEDHAKSPARLEQAPEYLYRLGRTQFEATL